MNGNIDTPRPVFLHGMWRSGSTYVWSRFRAAENTYCYYEPLNHGLGRLTRERIGRDTPELTAANAHPALSRPYFAEYEPLLKKRGVKYFNPRFSYEHFALDENEKDEKLKRYILSLNGHAAEAGKIPVLGFNASDLRIGWMNRNFNPVNIHISRDPLDIWLSYKKFAAQDNYTFFAAWMNTLEKNRHHPVFAPLAEKLRLRKGIEKILCKPKAYYRTAVQAMTPEDSYAMVFHLWCASTLHALSHCAHVIDMDRAAEPGYAENIARSIENSCGIPVTFSDLRAQEKPLPDIDHERIEQKVLRDFPADSPLFDRQSIRENLEKLNGRKAALAGAAL